MTPSVEPELVAGGSRKTAMWRRGPASSRNMQCYNYRLPIGYGCRAYFCKT